MKVIISHDVDHITSWEHKKDLIVPKAVIRGFIELSLGYISINELLSRLKGIVRNRLQNLEELLSFNRGNLVPSTFFIGMSNGNGLNYSLEAAKQWTSILLKEGFNVGVHGISHDNINDVKKEYLTFQHITGLDNVGIRMHNLNCDEFTIRLLNEANYVFDCSIVKMVDPFKIDSIWEFPLQIMDASIIEGNRRWQSKSLDQSIEATKRILDEAFDKGLNYFTILFHDTYFSDSFKTWKEWYIWLVKHLRDSNLEFISYCDAIKELEGNSN